MESPLVSSLILTWVSSDIQEELERLPVRIRRLPGKVVEGITESGLSKHLEGNAAVPAVHVKQPLRAIFWQTALERGLHL